MEQLDPQVVNLAKAIRQHESGGDFTRPGKSGEYGGYQYTEPTWDAYSKEFGINVPLRQASPEQQNEVTYKKIKQWKDSGYNVGQVASMWNAGPGKPNAYLEGHKGVNQYGVEYDTPLYAKKISEYYQQYKNESPSGVSQQSIPQNQTNLTQDDIVQNTQVDSPAQDERQQRIESGEPVSVNPEKSKPSFVGNIIRGLIKPEAQIVKWASDIGNKNPQPYESKYLGTLSPNTGVNFNNAGEKFKEAAGVGANAGLNLAGAKMGTGILGNLMKGSSKLEKPIVKQLLEERFGKGKVTGNLPQKETINTLRKTLEELTISEAKGKKGKAIINALKELEPSAEKESMIKSLLKKGINETTRFILYNSLGNKVGGVVHDILPK